MGRKEAREIAFKTLYQADIQKCSVKEILNNFLNENLSKKDKDYIENVCFGAEEHLTEIDEKISLSSKNWNINRISKVDKSALRLAVFEIFYRDDIPCSISIFEAVELVKTFDSPEAGGFVNGILRGILRNSGKEDINYDK